MFRALKTKKDTPKYGLLYHAPLVGSASIKNKGKISRSLAAKASLATRVDAFGDDVNFDMGVEHRAKLEGRLRFLEEGNLTKLSGTGKVKSKFEKYHAKSEVKSYPSEADSTLPTSSKKRKFSEVDTPKKLIEEIKSEEAEDEGTPSVQQSKKKKKKKDKERSEMETPVKEEAQNDGAEPSTSSKKKKKSKSLSEQQPEEVEMEVVPKSEKKKKKKAKQQEDSD